MSRSAWTSWNIVFWWVPFCFIGNYDSWQIKIVIKMEFSSVYLMKWIIWGIRHKQACQLDLFLRGRTWSQQWESMLKRILLIPNHNFITPLGCNLCKKIKRCWQTLKQASSINTATFGLKISLFLTHSAVCPGGYS